MGSGADMCPMALHGPWAVEVKEGLAITACSEPRVFARHARMLLRCLQDMRADDDIMTYKPCGQALQQGATVHHHTADRSHAWRYSTMLHGRPFADTVGRGYDPIGWGYARLQPDRMELRYRSLTTWQDRRDRARHAPLVPSLPCTGI
jgi:hypothetical protein